MACWNIENKITNNYGKLDYEQRRQSAIEVIDNETSEIK